MTKLSHDLPKMHCESVHFGVAHSAFVVAMEQKTGIRVWTNMRSFLLISLIFACGVSAAQHPVDTTQAQAMLKLLEHCRAGEVPGQEIEQVMQLSGTQLIVAQQNISRRVTSAQYRTVLVAACKDEIVQIEPSDSGARAKKGVEGLTQDVAPSLLWGRDHVDGLTQRLALARENKNFDEIVPVALQNLPEKVALSTKLYVVMGGRAGAAALESGIYIDLLSDAWRSRAKNAPMSPQQMVEFFAHETHHVGYGDILERRKSQLHLTEGEERAWNFLTALMMEGSATLLINAHGSWSELETQDHIQADLAHLPHLLLETQSLLKSTLDGTMSDQEYQVAKSDFVGEGYHATGARLLSVIEKVQGKSGVLRVMDDPRRLLTAYNECAAKANEPFRFDAQIAKALERLGMSSR